MNTKEHWETVYENKDPSDVSWTEIKPEVSLNLIKGTDLPKSASIIDIGGGDSQLVDHLLDAGYENITVLDISSNALEKAQKRLGPKALKVKWIVSDITEFQPTQTYDLWHDRATFHFLTSGEDIEKYKVLTSEFVDEHLIIGTFSKEGPLKCSGLNISQYNKTDLKDIFEDGFELEVDLTSDHVTPFETIQNFQYCRFRKK